MRVHGEAGQVNGALVRALLTAAAVGHEVTVVLGAPGAQRRLHVGRGRVTGADSEWPEDRLGALLVAEGRLDPLLLEPLAAEAQRQGRMLGAQLLAEGLLTPAELGAALVRQVRVRLERALVQPGPVQPGPPAARGQALVSWDVGAAVLAAFRQAVPLAAVEQQLARTLAAPTQPLPALAPAALELKPEELRWWRQLAQGTSPRALILERGEPAQRCVAALGTLRYLGAAAPARGA